MPTTRTIQSRRALAVFASLVVVTTSCDENLPSGPATFGTTLKIVVPHDTVVIGDSSSAQAQAVDAEGHVIQGLTFKWTSADATVLALGNPASNSDDAKAGRSIRSPTSESGKGGRHEEQGPQGVHGLNQNRHARQCFVAA